jgi:hypothetical protein
MPGVLAGAALTVAGSLLFTGRWRIATGVVAIVVVLASVALLVIKPAVYLSVEVTPADGFLEEDGEAVDPPRVTVLEPPPGDTHPVNACIRLRFRVEEPTWYGFVIAAKAAGPNADPRFYFEGQLTEDPVNGEHIGTIELDAADGVGLPYKLYIVAMDRDDVDYLSHTRPDEDETWWSSERLPAGAVVAAGPIDVRRDNNPEVQCPT